MYTANQYGKIYISDYTIVKIVNSQDISSRYNTVSHLFEILCTVFIKGLHCCATGYSTVKNGPSCYLMDLQHMFSSSTTLQDYIRYIR